MRSVSRHENEVVKGLALCAQKVFDHELAEVNQLRAQQSDYLSSLPTDAAECLYAAQEAINPNLDALPEELEEALHLSFALDPMIRHLQTDHPGPARDALIYIADRINSSLLQCARKMEHVSDILDGPSRAKAAARKNRPESLQAG